MRFGASGQISIRLDHYLIVNQLKNDLLERPKSRKYNKKPRVVQWFWGSAGQIYIQSDHYLIKDQLEYELWSFKPDLN